jgi:transposase-like protein
VAETSSGIWGSRPFNNESQSTVYVCRIPIVPRWASNLQNVESRQHPVGVPDSSTYNSVQRTIYSSFVNQLHRTPTTMPESYAEIEDRIEQACEKLYQCPNPNISAVAREFQVLQARLKARRNRRQSKQQRPAVNRKLTDAQELAVCLYLDRLDSIRTSALFEDQE